MKISSRSSRGRVARGLFCLLSPSLLWRTSSFDIRPRGCGVLSCVLHAIWYRYPLSCHPYPIPVNLDPIRAVVPVWGQNAWSLSQIENVYSTKRVITLSHGHTGKHVNSFHAVIHMRGSSPHERFLAGCSSPFMRLAEHLTALRAWC